MAIVRDEKLSTDSETVLRINNGDLSALKNIKEAWNLSDLESAVIFAVGVLRAALETKQVLVGKKGIAEPVPLTPGDQLVKTEDGETHGDQTAIS